MNIISISWVAGYHRTSTSRWDHLLLCLDSDSTGPSDISTPSSVTHMHKHANRGEGTCIFFTHNVTYLHLSFSCAVPRLVQVWEPPSHSHNHVQAAWHYRKIMMCHPVGSFISMFYNRRRVEVIKLCHHYNEPGPPLNRQPMRHWRPAW